MPSIREVMTKNPITLPSSAPVTEAARAMRDSDVGAVLLLDSQEVTGIVTDRDIALRVVADGQDPDQITVGDIATKGVKTVNADDDAGEAIRLMKDEAIRRVPVVEQNRPVGIVSIGDLAENFDADSLLGHISEQPPNN